VWVVRHVYTLQQLTHFPDTFYAVGCAEDRDTKYLQVVLLSQPICVLDYVEDVNQTYFRNK